MAATLDQIMGSLNPVYQPQIDATNQQLAALPGQQAADQAALDASKTQGFNDITSAANSRGVLYSGVPIDEQSTYLATKYLPAEANLKSNFADKGYQLTSTINSLRAKEATDAQNIQANQAKAEADAAYKQQQLQLSRERLNVQAQRSSASAAKAADKSKLVTDPSGGFQFYGGQGQKVTAAQYVAGKGGNFQDLVNILNQSKNPGDAQILRDMNAGLNPAQLAAKYPWVFGGV